MQSSAQNFGRCPRCTQKFGLFNAPMTGACGHTYCSHCIHTLSLCPECKRKNSFAAPSVNSMVFETIQMTDKQSLAKSRPVQSQKSSIAHQSTTDTSTTYYTASEPESSSEQNSSLSSGHMLDLAIFSSLKTNTLSISNLTKEVTERDLYLLFCSYGDIVCIELLAEPDEKSCTAQITFTSDGAADSAKIAMNGKMIRDRKVAIDFYFMTSMEFAKLDDQMLLKAYCESVANNPNEPSPLFFRKLNIFNLPLHIPESNFMLLAIGYGEVVNAQVCKERRGDSVVTFHSVIYAKEADAANALRELNGKTRFGSIKPLVVEYDYKYDGKDPSTERQKEEEYVLGLSDVFIRKPMHY